MKKLISIIAAVAMVAGFTLTAAASEFNFYGNARVNTFVTDVDTYGATAADKDLDHDLNNVSRLGANVKVSDDLSARFEMGFKNNSNSNTVWTRLMYGTWNFGAGTLTVGQFWTPVNFFISSDVYADDNGMLGYGSLNNLRQSGVQFQFGDFKLAFLEPSSAVDASSGSGVASSIVGEEADTTIPKIEVGYTYNIDGGFLKAVAGYNTFEIDGTSVDSDVDAWTVGLGAKYSFGPVSIAGIIWRAENSSAYRSGLWSQGAVTTAVAADGTVTDVEEFGYLLVLGYKLNDMVSFEAGYGYSEAEADDASLSTNEDDARAWYVQAPITLTPGFNIIPQIGQYDNKTNASGTQEADSFFYGLKWQINF